MGVTLNIYFRFLRLLDSDDDDDENEKQEDAMNLAI